MTLTDCPTNYDPVSFYLMCAYTYYVEDESIVPDYQFDELATWLLENYDTLEHQHKELIPKDDLQAGTYLGEYPLMVKGAVNYYRRYILGMTTIQGIIE